MKHYVFENVSLNTQIVFQSKYYTVARATTQVKDADGIDHAVYAEGVSRRSYKDLNDEVRGRDIAIGRAKKALAKKLNGEHPRHVLMNG